MCKIWILIPSYLYLFRISLKSVHAYNLLEPEIRGIGTICSIGTIGSTGSIGSIGSIGLIGSIGTFGSIDIHTHLFRLINMKAFSSFVKVASDGETSWMKNLWKSMKDSVINFQNILLPVQGQGLLVDDVLQGHVRVLHVARAGPVLGNAGLLKSYPLKYIENMSL